MDPSIRKFRVFIASPGDLAREREVAREVVRSVSLRLGDRGGLVLEPIGWEDVPIDVGRPQALINPLVRECDLFVGILWSRFGTETGVAESGTAEEFVEAERVRQETGDRPTIKVFFSDAPVPMDRLRGGDGRMQFDKVQAFRDRYVAERRGLAKTYKDVHEFRDLLRQELEAWCAERSPVPALAPHIAPQAGPGIPSAYATALRREIRLVSFIGPPTSDVVERPEVESVYVPVQVEAVRVGRPEAARDRPEEVRRTSFRTAWEEWRPAEHGPLVILG